jgi:hypothetical protein
LRFSQLENRFNKISNYKIEAHINPWIFSGKDPSNLITLPKTPKLIILPDSIFIENYFII